jgi:tryptophan halogenase
LVHHVGILGGGSAGYLAALALRRHHPELEITLIESSRVPVIGVGEATTPLMPQFLHVDLGLDIHNFFRRVEPTLKLGIHFAWGPHKEHCFNYPFGPNRVLEAMVWDGHLGQSSLQGMLMNAGAIALEHPLPTGGLGDRDGVLPPRSYLGTEIAYHLDNRRFVSYLKEQAKAFGVHSVDAQIIEAEVDESGEEIRTLVADDGRRFSFDLYLDCSGFRSLLLGDALGSPFQSYETSLFTDRAVVASAPHGGRVAPYTVARAMDAGWCWNTPQRQEDHHGYVFSSAFLSDEAAAKEMRRKNPGLGDTRVIRFRPGRREHFMRGNTVALGNSYGFVEPLESTALHMLIRQIGLLLQSFPLRCGERGLAATLNRRVGASWDYLRWFLALHYRFNGALDTSFWRHCRTAVDVSSHGELLTAFGERGPLSFDPVLSNSFDYPDPLWGPEGIDVILLGQGVPTRLPLPTTDQDSWRAHVLRCRRAVARSLPQAEALHHLDQSPELLESFAETFRRAGPAFGASPK